MNYAKFWSDDFDMDLFRIYPNVIAECLGTLQDRKLWTVGHESYGRLNHPTVWNTHGAYVWLEKPNLVRDARGWFAVRGCVDDSTEIECTWLELLRDQWPHSYSFVLMPEEIRFPGPRRDMFDAIMWDLRGWKKQDTTAARLWLRDWIMDATRNLDRIIQRRLAIAGGQTQRDSGAEPQAIAGRDPVEPAQRADCVEEKT